MKWGPNTCKFVLQDHSYQGFAALQEQGLVGEADCLHLKQVCVEPGAQGSEGVGRGAGGGCGGGEGHKGGRGTQSATVGLGGVLQERQQVFLSWKRNEKILF